MSVLYKALQKAEKENELRQSASESSFDPQRLAASGALKFTGSGASKLNRVVMAGIFVVAVGGSVGFLVFKESLMPPAAPQVAQVPVIAPPPPEPTAPPTAVASAPVVPPVDGVASALEVASATPPADTVPNMPVAATAPEQPAAIPQTPPPALPPETAVAAAAPAERLTPRVTPPAPERMPQIPSDSPARMLSPPIAIRRTEIDLAGVGDQVQVREVSKVARSNVAAGYDALVAGSYDTALGFYDQALVEEPNSVLALLGRGAALQKLARNTDAQGAYERVLKLDPQNREALSNVTAIAGDRAPQDALAKLLELERENGSFSPIKAQIGLIYAKMGSMELALDYLRRAAALSPEAVMYHYNMALVLDHLGRRDQAVASYENVLLAMARGRGPVDLSAADIERRVQYLRAR